MKTFKELSKSLPKKKKYGEVGVNQNDKLNAIINHFEISVPEVATTSNPFSTG